MHMAVVYILNYLQYQASNDLAQLNFPDQEILTLFTNRNNFPWAPSCLQTQTTSHEHHHTCQCPIDVTVGRWEEPEVYSKLRVAVVRVRVPGHVVAWTGPDQNHHLRSVATHVAHRLRKVFSWQRLACTHAQNKKKNSFHKMGDKLPTASIELRVV